MENMAENRTCEQKMMIRKALLAGVVAVLFVFFLIGVSRAENRCVEEFFTEGPTFIHKEEFKPMVVKFEGVDHETFFSEGPRVSKCRKGEKTLVPVSLTLDNFYSEGPDYRRFDQRGINIYRQQALDFMPAAGK